MTYRCTALWVIFL